MGIRPTNQKPLAGKIQYSHHWGGNNPLNKPLKE